MPGVSFEIRRGLNREGEVVDLPGARVTFGRGADSTFRLESDIASREHAVVRLDGDTWYVEDLGSRNGTLLNGRRVKTAALRPADVLTFGESGIQIRIKHLIPMPLAETDGEDKTRFMRIARPPGRAAPPPAAEEEVEAILVQPMERTGTTGAMSARPDLADAEAITQQVVKRSAWRRIPWLAILGLAFGVVTAFAVWPEAWFPYREVTAPGPWAVYGIGKFMPSFAADHGLWIGRVALALYYALVGFLLGRPLKRFPWIALIAGAHLAGALLLDKIQ